MGVLGSLAMRVEAAGSWYTLSHCHQPITGGAAGSRTGLVRGAVGAGPQDAETQPKTE